MSRTSRAIPSRNIEISDALVPRTDEAIAFLQDFHPGGPWHLVAIKDGAVSGQTFRQLDPMKRWIEKRQWKWNIYFHVNPLRRDPLRGKALKTDVAEAICLHVDVDDPRDETLERLRGFQPTPTAIVNSGGGYQAFWMLDNAVGDLDNVERRNMMLAKTLGGDNCHNIDRIMRLPGTINVLSKLKIKRGRKAALAHVVEFENSRKYELSDFEASDVLDTKLPLPIIPDEVPIVGIEGLPHSLDDFIKTLLLEGDDPIAPLGSSKPHFKSRSEALWRVVCELVRAGVSDITIAGAILNPALKISASVLDKPSPKRYAFRQVTAK